MELTGQSLIVTLQTEVHKVIEESPFFVADWSSPHQSRQRPSICVESDHHVRKCHKSKVRNSHSGEWPETSLS